MGVSTRNAILLFTGAVDVVFGIVLIMMGADSVILYAHGAVGVPMWAGIFLIVVGVGNLISVATHTKKRNRDMFNINLGALLLNLIGLILAVCIIGFFTWGAWSVLSLGVTGNFANVNDKLIALYTAIILMAVIILLMSLVAMFMDCCNYALFGGESYYGAGPPARPRYYDGPYVTQGPAHIYKQ